MAMTPADADAEARVRPHWYRMHVGECPVCGRDQSWRERVYGKRPDDPVDRYVHIPETLTYDYCNAL